MNTWVVSRGDMFLFVLIHYLLGNILFGSIWSFTKKTRVQWTAMRARRLGSLHGSVRNGWPWQVVVSDFWLPSTVGALKVMLGVDSVLQQWSKLTPGWLGYRLGMQYYAVIQRLHPRRFTWNLRIHPWKRKIIFQTMAFSDSMLIFEGVFDMPWTKDPRYPSNISWFT